MTGANTPAAAVPGGDPWDGEPGWPRPRHVPPRAPGGAFLPATYVQSDPADPTSGDHVRLQQVFSEFRCQVCAEPVLEIDAVGWVLEPRANMGGACCTRCMHLALLACPHLADAAPGAWQLWAIVDPTSYTWTIVDDVADGHVELARADGAIAFTRAEFDRHHRSWRGAQRVAT